MYRDFDHGYAATIHKTQGSTIDNTYVLGSKHFDKHTAYVAMSRHRDNVTMYYGKDEFRNFDDLQRVMSREQAKGLIVDYGLPRGVEIDDRLIKAEMMRSYEEIKRDAEQRIAENKRDFYPGYQDRFYSRIEQKLHERAQEEYRQKMGITVEFVRDRAVAGYYIGLQEVDGRKYAMIDTHAVTKNGNRYLVPYECDQRKDDVMRYRRVEYDGHTIEEEWRKNLEKERQEIIARDKAAKRELTHDRDLSPSESKYCQLMQEHGLQVAFVNEKTVEGYFKRIEDVGENKYAVIETKHGAWMVPYNKQYDNMPTHRYVEYDGHKMSPAQNKSIERNLDQGLGLGKGLGFER